MRILTFCAYYTPEIAASLYLSTNMFEDWASYGSEVKAFAPTPTRGVDKETICKYKKIPIEVSCDNKLIVRRFSLMQEKKNTLLRAFRYFLLTVLFFHYGLHTEADIMFIDSTPPIQGLLATVLKKIKRIPYVYNLQDIFPDSLVNTGLCKKKSFVFKIGRMIEKITYDNADHIITISEDFKQNLMGKGVAQEKISVVYNWVDENKVSYIPRERNALFDEYKLDRNKYYIAYSGNIGLTQNMDLLIEVAVELNNDEEIGIILVGDGAYLETVKQKIEEFRLKNVFLLPFQPYERISEVFSLGDIGLIISKGGVGSNSVPSKTWSYMAAGRPIIASFDLNSELCRIITENECGICVEPDNAICLINAIKEMKKNNNGFEAGQRGKEYVLRNLTRGYGTRKYYEILQAVNKRQNRG